MEKQNASLAEHVQAFLSVAAEGDHETLSRDCEQYLATERLKGLNSFLEAIFSEVSGDGYSDPNMDPSPHNQNLRARILEELDFDPQTNQLIEDISENLIDQYLSSQTHG